MLDSTLCVLNRVVYNNGPDRCRSCGQRSVTGSDGFLMSRCMNCGSWQSAANPTGLGFGEIKDIVITWCKQLGKSILGGVK